MFKRLIATAALATLPLTGAALPATAAAPIAATTVAPQSRADDAIAWFAARNGSTAYQGYCEKAVENSYGRTGVYAWPSPTGTTPYAGAPRTAAT